EPGLKRAISRGSLVVTRKRRRELSLPQTPLTQRPLHRLVRSNEDQFSGPPRCPQKPPAKPARKKPPTPRPTRKPSLRPNRLLRRRRTRAALLSLSFRKS